MNLNLLSLLKYFFYHYYLFQLGILKAKQLISSLWLDATINLSQFKLMSPLIVSKNTTLFDMILIFKNNP